MNDWLICPRCGAESQRSDFEGIAKCPDCGKIWAYNAPPEDPLLSMSLPFSASHDAYKTQTPVRFFSKTKANALFITIGCAFVILALVFIFIIQPYYLRNNTVELSVERRGNTPGNYANNSFVFQVDEWIYYVGSRWDLPLYKMRIDGSEKQRIGSFDAYGIPIDAFSYINIVDEWIYYANVADKHRIYKIRTDGTGRERINDDRSFTLVVIDNWIYYERMYEDNELYTGNENIGLYRIRIDGSDRQKLLDSKAVGLNYENGWLYFGVGRTNGRFGPLYKMRPDGSDLTILSDMEVEVGIVDGDWVYFKARTLDPGYTMHRVRTDGEGYEQLSEDSVRGFNISEGWIYYSKRADGIEDLYRMRYDGTEKELIYKVGTELISVTGVVGDWIFYTTNYFIPSSEYRVRYDGTGHEDLI